MGTLAIERNVAVPPSQVWGVVTDWAGYARWMPLITDRCNKALFRKVVNAMALDAERAPGASGSGQNASGR
jgi:uncharacterized protein YndB with AHSA1/START domain